MKRKEIFLGILFAIVVTIFMNYSAIDRLSTLTDMDRRDPMLDHLYYSMVLAFVVSMLHYVFFTYAFKLLDRKFSIYLAVGIIVLGAISISYTFGLFDADIRDLMLPKQPEGTRKFLGRNDTNIMISRHLLVGVLNFLYVYILRLSYQNQEIRIRNEHLKLEKIKAEHNALIQQINPHFFFNSLNGLSYYISSQQTEEAVSYLDNLTTVFRQILKHNDKDIYSLNEEIEFIKSYVYMLQKRYEGKFFVSFEIDSRYESYLLPRLSLLPLVENIIKHNKISSASIINVKVYTNDNSEVVVENNIAPKLEVVESTGIGLTNLDAQYKLLAQKGIEVSDSQGIFRVSLPLILPS